MYTGVDSFDRTAQLDRVELLIAGYKQAVMFHGVQDPGVDAYSGFGEYLARRFGWDVQAGPIRAIRRETESDDAAGKCSGAFLPTSARTLADLRRLTHAYAPSARATISRASPRIVVRWSALTMLSA
jgi:hypothetical protein